MYLLLCVLSQIAYREGELEAWAALAGFVGNAAAGKLLKRLAAQHRPVPRCALLRNCGGFGMPSSHAQTMAFASALHLGYALAARRGPCLPATAVTKVLHLPYAWLPAHRYYRALRRVSGVLHLGDTCLRGGARACRACQPDRRVACPAPCAVPLALQGWLALSTPEATYRLLLAAACAQCLLAQTRFRRGDPEVLAPCGAGWGADSRPGRPIPLGLREALEISELESSARP